MKELKNLSAAEVARRVEDLRNEYFTLQEAIRLGKERNHAQLKPLRRSIARHLHALRLNK